MVTPHVWPGAPAEGERERVPKGRARSQKIAANRARDRLVTRALRARGWRVVRISDGARERGQDRAPDTARQRSGGVTEVGCAWAMAATTRTHEEERITAAASSPDSVLATGHGSTQSGGVMVRVFSVPRCLGGLPASGGAGDHFTLRSRMTLCVPSGRCTSATTGERFPRNASHSRRCSSSNVMREYSSPVSTSSGLTYSWPFRGVPLSEYSVTKNTARWNGASPSASVWTAGGSISANGSPCS